MNQEDADLLDGLKKGDKLSFQEIFSRYYKELCTTAVIITKDADEAEDIVQKLFVSIWEQRQKIEIKSSIKSYLLTSVKNRSKNYLSHQKIKWQYQTEHPLKEDLERDNLFSDPYLLAKIKATLEQLPPKCLEIFELNRFSGLKYREIAEKLNISQKTVEAQMGKALKFLHESLKDYAPLLLVLAML